MFLKIFNNTNISRYFSCLYNSYSKIIKDKIKIASKKKRGVLMQKHDFLG